MIIKQGWHIRTCTSKSLPVFHGGAPSFTPITLMSFFRNHSRRIKSSAELLYNSPTGTSPMREGGCVFTMKWAHLTEHLPRCSSASSPAGREHCYLEEPILDGAGEGAATQQFWKCPAAWICSGQRPACRSRGVWARPATSSAKQNRGHPPHQARVQIPKLNLGDMRCRNKGSHLTVLVGGGDWPNRFQ